MFEFITVRELYELYINDRDQLDGIEYVELQGWIRTNRNSGKVGFLALNDGTYFKNVQVVYLDEIIDNYEETTCTFLKYVPSFKKCTSCLFR